MAKRESANVNLSAFGFGLKVVALEYESDDPPGKIIAYYQDQLKRYGNVLQCHGSGFKVDDESHGWRQEGRCLMASSSVTPTMAAIKSS